MSSQIDFELYGQINILKQITEVYNISDEISEEIENCLNLITTKHYNVAVVGEFNRGKSSLINALLGGSILPMDILPTTAVINRITYSTKEKVEVFYKSGDVVAINVDEIDEVVTKSTKEKEKTALSIDKVVIHYPAIICQNNVDIIDTPGLNEDALMTAVTLKQLKEIDAAIMVVSALSPFSEVEKNIVINMMENNEINDIVFVVSFIDLLNEEERPRIISTISSRIEGIVAEITQKHSGNQIIKEKAERILAANKIFGVSSLLALEAYETGNNRKLEESNYPFFRKELTGILTAGQSVNVVDKVYSLITLAHKKIDEWLLSKEDTMKERIELLKKGLDEIESYCKKSKNATDKSIANVESEFDSTRIDKGFKDFLIKQAIERLSKIKENSEEELRLTIGEINILLHNAAQEKVETDYNILTDLYDKCLDEIVAARGKTWIDIYSKLPDTEFQPHLFKENIKNEIDKIKFPEIDFLSLKLVGTEYILHCNLIAHIRAKTEAVCEAYYQELEQYRANCRKILFATIKDEKSICEASVSKLLNEKIEETRLDLIVLGKDHKKNTDRITRLLNENNKILEEVRGK